MSDPAGQVDTGRVTHIPQMHREVSWKASVRVATTANGTLSTAFDNGSTIDGVTLATGDRILIKNQTDQKVNGIYVVNASGAPSRTYDSDIGPEFPGAAVLVREGSTNAGTMWYCTNLTDPVLGTDNVTWSALGGGGGGAPTTADYLVGTSQAGLSAEIVVGTTPGGELGNTWASPTVDTTHSGSAHADFIAKSVLTTQDDIIVRDASAPARLAKGSDGQVLTVDPTTHHLVWATPSSGFTNPMTTRGDLIIENSSPAPDRLPIGAANKFLHSNGTDPSWQKVVEDDLNLTDLTTANASTSAHGFLKKLTGSTTDFLRADGAFADPAVPPISGSAFFSPAYGDGSDGSVTISVDTTITRDMYYDDLTVNTGINLDTALLRVFVKGTLTLTGTIRCNGNNGGNGGTGTAGAGGAAGAAGTQQTGGAVQNLSSGTVGRAGAIGGINANGSGNTAGSDTTYGYPNVPAGTAGGISGSGRSGGTGGAVGTSTNTIQEKPVSWPSLITWRTLGGTQINLAAATGIAAQAGSGGGAASSGGGGSGGSGSGGGVVVVCARTITGVGNIQAKGGNGGNGGNGLATAQAGGGAAGNGGQGGIGVLIYNDKSGWSGSIDVAGGTKGTKGNAGGGAGSTDGGVGNDGNAGKSYQFRVA